MSPVTSVATSTSTLTIRQHLASFLDLMCRRSDCTPPGDGRSGARYFRSWPLTIHLPQPHSESICFGTALYDASDTGIGFLSEIPIEPGTIVHIKLLWYDKNAPLVSAVVRHVTLHRDNHVIGCEYILQDTHAEPHNHDSGTATPAVA